LRDLFHQAPSLLIISHPLTDALLHSLRDMDHLSLLSHPEGEIKAGMEFASRALATRLSTLPMHRDQTATQERLFMKDLGETGTCFSFGIRQGVSVVQEITPFLSDI
jgi:hypothetical protein